jgi:hypothetical protein
MGNGEREAWTQAIELLKQRNCREALDLLKQRVNQETDGEGHALLALAHYHPEEHPSAAEHYSAAVQSESTNQEWRELLASAKANVISSGDVPVPDIYFFDRDASLANPELSAGTLPPHVTSKRPGTISLKEAKQFC